MSIYAVGDIQGCYEPLMRLLDKLQFDEKKDQLWSVGDLVNRGPESMKVLQFCKQLGDSFTGVLGNHDLHLLAVASCNRKVKTADTFDDVLIHPEREEILHWLRHLKLLHVDEKRNIAMSHAGIAPMWSIKKASKLASEVEAVIQDDNLVDLYYKNMYGDDPNCWDQELSGPTRWRVITNYFTRMRFVSDSGQLELNSKSDMLSAPDGYQPWFLVPNRKAEKQCILFGHWAALMGKTDSPNVHALDTGCAWGHHLSAVNVAHPNQFISVKHKKKKQRD